MLDMRENTPTKTNSIRSDNLVLMTLTMNPPVGRRKRRVYAGVGLCCRWVGEGTYRVQRNDGRPFDQFPIQIQIASPWAEELTAVVISKIVEIPKVVGEDEDKLEISYEAVQAPRWLAVVAGISRRGAIQRAVLVRIYKIPRLPVRRSRSQNLKVVRSWQTNHTMPSDGAGFCLMTFKKGKKIDG
jgi:hypothetical protein